MIVQSDFEYIYKDDRKNKSYIGEVNFVEKLFRIGFTVIVEEEVYLCQIEKHEEWYLYLTFQEVETELSSLNDIFWNSDKIIGLIKNYKHGMAIAYAIKEVYKRNGDAFIL